MNNSKKMLQKRAIVFLLAVLCVSILFSVVSFVRPREVYADEVTLVDSTNVTYSSTDDSFVVDGTVTQDTYLYFKELGYISGGMQIGLNTQRTDGGYQNGSWACGGIIIDAQNPAGWGVQYRMFAMSDSGNIVFYIISNNGDATDGGFLIAEIRMGYGTITGTGAPIRYDIAFINNKIYVLINNSVNYVFAKDDLNNTSITTLKTPNGTLSQSYDAGWFDPLFDVGATYSKKLGIIAGGWMQQTFSNVSCNAITELPTMFNASSGIFTDASGVGDDTGTSATLSGGNVKYFRDTTDNTSLNTTGNFYAKFSLNRTDGVTDTVGTWETAGLYVETASNDYRLFFMREADNVTVLYIVKNNAESLEYRIDKNYSGTGATIDLEFIYIASEETYYIVWGSDVYALSYTTKGIRKNEDLYSSTSDKKIGMFANVTVDLTNVETSIDETTVANKKPATTPSLFIANPLFFNNMFTTGVVLQRNKKVKIFGRGGDIDNTVKVTFNGQTKTSTVTVDGWSVYLDEMSANATGQTMTVEQLNGSTVVSTVTVTDVLVGEVFLGNGQSNMQTTYEYYASTGMAGTQTKSDYYTAQTGRVFTTEYATYNNYNNIRIMTEPYYKPSTPTVNNSPTCYWTTAGDSTGALTYTGASAFALAYASHLSHMLGDSVPVGVYVSAIGGSYIENWLPPESISKLEASGNLNPYASGSDGGLGLFYNGMIHTSVGFTFGAIVFYQGCANSSEEVKYREAFKEYASVYRTLYEDANLPIISMQLPQYNEGDPWMEFRDMQQNLINDIANLYIVCGIDRGDNNTAEGNAYDNIHPADKWGHAERAAGVYAKLLGLTATAGTPYGVSPRIIAASKAGNDIMITLDANATTLTASNVSAINGFEYSTDGTTWTATTAYISNNTIYISGAGSATHIRYLYAEVFADNSYFIYNEYNLPVFPVLSMSVSAALDGFVNGYLYQNGSLFNGTYTDGKLYQEGLPFTGKYTDGMYYSAGSLMASGFVTVDNVLYSVSNGVMTAYTGVYSVDNKYYSNGTILASGKVEVSGVVYSVTNGNMTKYTGVYNNKYYENGDLKASGFVTVDNVLYSISNGTMTAYTGVYTEDNKYYSNGTILASGTVTYNNKVYTVTSGNMSLYTGVYNSKYYENGDLKASGTVTVEGKLYTVANGVMTLVNGVHTDGKYYEDGVLKASGTVTVEDKLYTVANGVMTLVNGVHTDGKYYEDGVLMASGTVTVDGKLYTVANGVMTLVNGMHTDGKYYAQGVLATGVYENKLYVSGVIYTGIYTEDNKCYVNGVLHTGEYNGKYYINGVETTLVLDGQGNPLNGVHTDGKLYQEGLLFTGKYTDGKYYENGDLKASGFVTVDNVLYSVANGVMTAYTGVYETKYYNEGALYTGYIVYESKLYNVTAGEMALYTGKHTDNKYYENGVLYTGFIVDEMKLYTVTSGEMTLFKGVYAQDNKYYEDGLVYNGIVEYQGKLYTVTAGTMALYTGVYNVNDKLYVDGVIYTGIYSEDNKCYVNGELYTGDYNGKYYVNGVETEKPADAPSFNPADGKLYTSDAFTTLFNGVYADTLYVDGVVFTGKHTDNKYYFNGTLLESGLVKVEDILYSVSNGVMTAYTGVYDIDNKYYFNGTLLENGEVIVGGVAYKVTDGTMTVFTGVLNNKYYENGTVFTGTKKINNILYTITAGEMVKFTGTHTDGRVYVEGELLSGVYVDGKLYKDGLLFTGKNTEDGKYYIDGVIVNVKLDENGELFTGYDAQGNYYEFGLLFNGVNPDTESEHYGKYYENGALKESGYVIYQGKAYSVDKGNMTLFNGILNDKYYEYGELVTGIRIITVQGSSDTFCYDIKDGVMTKYTGAFNGLYYSDGVILESGYAIVDGKAYSVEDGVMTIFSGIMDDKFYIDGLPYTGTKIINNVCYSVSNGVMTKYTGVFNEVYYKNGEVLAEGIIMYQNKLYSITNGAMTLFTGMTVLDGILYTSNEGVALKFTGKHTDGKYYSKGIILTSGVVIFEEKAYLVVNGDMALYTGEYNGGEYENGELVSGTPTDPEGPGDLVLDGSGKPLTGKHTDGKYYEDGVLYTGIKRVSGRWYSIVDGVMTLYTGLHEGNYYVDGRGYTGEYAGKIYRNGNPFTGKNTSTEYGELNKYYKDGVILSEGTVIEGGKCWSVNNGNMSLYTGMFNGKEYRNGEEVVKGGDAITEDEKPYILWNCSSSFAISGVASITVVALILAVIVIRLKRKKD